MKAKQRIFSAIKGDPIDRVPWSPNLPYWWETQADILVNRGELDILQVMGTDPMIRGRYPYMGKHWIDMFLFNLKFKTSSISEQSSGNESYKVYETPIGKLEFVYKHSSSGDTWFLHKHGVSTKEDFKILTYLFEDIVVEPDYEKFHEVARVYGNEVLLVPQLNPYHKSSFQSMLEYWVGTEELIYMVTDSPEIVEEALQAMRRVSTDAARISALSDAEIFLTWEDSSTTNISPSLYERFILPEINEWCDILHNQDKLYMQHACGHLKDLIPLMAKSKIDCIESISPPPTGNIELWDARKFLPPHIALIGGIEPTVFLDSNLEELEEYVKKLINHMKGTRFVLANSDSCPPGVDMEKFKLVSNIVRGLV